MSYGDRSNIFVTCPGACKQNPKYDTARPSCFPRWPPRAHNLSDNYLDVIRFIFHRETCMTQFSVAFSIVHKRAAILF